MGLADITPADESDGSSSSSGSGSSSSSSGYTLSGVAPSDFPVYRKRTPYLVLREQDGEWDYLKYPDTPEVEFRFDWYTDAEFVDADVWEEDDGWVKYWFSEDEFRGLVHTAKQKLGYNLWDLLQEQPSKIPEVVRMAANERVASKKEKTETCPVCQIELHVVYDEYEVMGHRRVCPDHNVRDLAAAGLLD